jgi:glycosyltransferase involved in cell wall biosynthesis
VKLLVVSFPCVTAINQSFYADVKKETGWEVTLVIPKRWKTEYGQIEGCERWPSFRGKIVCHPIFLPGDIPRHIYRSWFVDVIRNENPDAIYMHHEPYGFATFQVYAANRIAGKRPIGFYAAQNLLKRYPPPISQLERWVFRESSYAFPVTTGAREILRTKHYKGRAEVLPLAVSSDIYKPSPEWSQTYREQMNIPAKRVIFGYIGRLVEEKGLFTLFSALKSLHDVDWELYLIGGGPLEDELRKRTSSLGHDMQNRIKFIGYVPHADAPKWLSMLDVMVLPSETRANWKEQFGRVLVESMACGTPVVGSDSGEIPKIIAATGGGIIFPEANASALAEALRQMGSSEDVRNRYAENGRSAVLVGYDQVRLAQKFASVIEEAV